MVYLSRGLSKNGTLERLNLAENVFNDRESIQNLVRNLLENLCNCVTFRKKCVITYGMRENHY